MVRWEYLHVTAVHMRGKKRANTVNQEKLPREGQLPIHEYLSQRGNEGWELVSAFFDGAAWFHFWLKRQTGD